MGKIKDLKIVFTFRSEDRIPAATVAKLITLVETQINDSEIKHWHSIKKEFPQLSEDIIKKFTEDAGTSNFKGLYLENASKGSIELLTIVSAASTWILLNTIGKSVIAAYEKSELHNKIVNFLLLRIGDKVEQLIMAIKRTIKMNMNLKYENIEIEYDKKEKENAIEFYIITTFKNEYPMTQGQLQLVDNS